jgi:hypothetical protein
MTTDEPRTLRLEKLLTALSDGELESLCLHHFRTVQQDFTGGMGKRQKILRLIDHCDRRGLLDKLEQLATAAASSSSPPASGPSTPPTSVSGSVDLRGATFSNASHITITGASVGGTLPRRS